MLVLSGTAKAANCSPTQRMEGRSCSLKIADNLREGQMGYLHLPNGLHVLNYLNPGEIMALRPKEFKEIKRNHLF